MASAATRGYRIGFDIGGTFTDLIIVGPDGSAHSRKVLSSPSNYADAVIEGISDLLKVSGAPADGVAEAVHGTTIATNAILERQGACVALITTEGFRDILEIGRLRMPGLFNLDYVRPAPLVPRRRRFELSERMGNRGDVLVPLDPASLEAAVRHAIASGAESIAVSLIHAYQSSARARGRRAVHRVRPDLPCRRTSIPRSASSSAPVTNAT